MNRLTQRTPYGASLALDNPQCDAEAAAQVKIQLRKACDRLASYEDTGLYPEEVARLTAENAVLRSRLDKAREVARELLECEDERKGPDAWILMGVFEDNVDALHELAGEVNK